MRGERIVFAGLEFAVDRGGLLLLRGRNGSGKSSLLRLMAGLLPPFAGALWWNDQTVDRGDHGSNVHYVGHLDGVKAVLTPREMLRFWAGLYRREAAAQRAEAALVAFGLEAIADLPGRYLSAGQRRRLALARGIAAPVPLWLLDEPTVGLDAEAIAALDQAVSDHRASGGIVVLSTHVEMRSAGAVTLDVEQYCAEASG